jgi:hypothetical protein
MGIKKKRVFAKHFLLLLAKLSIGIAPLILLNCLLFMPNIPMFFFMWIPIIDAVWLIFFPGYFYIILKRSADALGLRKVHLLVSLAIFTSLYSIFLNVRFYDIRLAGWFEKILYVAAWLSIFFSVERTRAVDKSAKEQTRQCPEELDKARCKED